MNYKYDKAKILGLIKREVSRLASSASTEEGQSLYDSFMMKARDEETIEQYLKSAMTRVLIRLEDIVVSTPEGFFFNVPDFDPLNEDAVSDTLDMFLVYHATASWLNEKVSPKTEGYAALATAQLESLNQLLKTRRKPTRV